ncbi:hypothetical protein [Sorangium sp. So ce1335]|uniref:hypothetical protein n=1 Tax=Sorangium sp. So ce1335 TaxID=3133335 RepID=UPI003F5EFACE
MHHARSGFVFFIVVTAIGVTACAASGPATEAASPAVEDRAGSAWFIDADGNVKTWVPGSSAPSDLSLQDDVMEVRCRVSTEGEYYGCRRLRGPRSAEDDVFAALRTMRAEPATSNGEPVEVWRTLTFRLGFRMN